MWRRGRCGEVCRVALPLDEERIEICKIHISRRGMDVSQSGLEQLTEFTKEWTGAEIEQCVISALTKARLADRDVTTQDLINIAVKMVPLSRTMSEQIRHIRGWAFEIGRASCRERG